MTVKDLIKKLNNVVDQDLPIYFEGKGKKVLVRDIVVILVSVDSDNRIGRSLDVYGDKTKFEKEAKSAGFEIKKIVEIH